VPTRGSTCALTVATSDSPAAMTASATFA
jgi:hypothetical protein